MAGRTMSVEILALWKENHSWFHTSTQQLCLSCISGHQCQLVPSYHRAGLALLSSSCYSMFHSQCQHRWSCVLAHQRLKPLVKQQLHTDCSSWLWLMIYQTDDNYWQAYIKSTFNLMADYNTKDSLLLNNTIVEINNKKRVLAEYQHTPIHLWEHSRWSFILHYASAYSLWKKRAS